MVNADSVIITSHILYPYKEYTSIMLPPSFTTIPIFISSYNMMYCPTKRMTLAHTLIFVASVILFIPLSGIPPVCSNRYFSEI